MSNRTVALVPAAGRGLRMGGQVPKQFLSLGGQPLVLHSLHVLQASSAIHEIILAVPQSEMDYCLKEIVAKHHFTKVTKVVPGGAERQDSVRHALEAVHDDVDVVLVHDAVRPFLTERMVEEVVSRLVRRGQRLSPSR
ncbi:MAG: NTP transferase domain-containing protein [Nitrospira sp.]|nr:NTP transferase domain-containing protein [Nitrospira sp.]